MIKPDWQQTPIAGSQLFVFEYADVNGKQWERVRRPPGVRLLCLNRDSSKVILQSEYRREMKSTDWRLPGGKMFDFAKPWMEYLEAGKDLIDMAQKKSMQEAQEEAGIIVNDNPEFLEKVIMTATFERDLYYMTSHNWELTNQHAREEGEIIHEIKEFNWSEVAQLIKNGELKESQTIGVLARNFIL
ncbi:TPA: NUDIX hydrolase [Candidatus Saccharibacteria bacterium]|nr:NUDIX hydrolase [Candidatus Saccharibacteria bacterium]HIO87465.1 NUDIX hydrolase [Candidatus Saccharibacteria bacterium]